MNFNSSIELTEEDKYIRQVAKEYEVPIPDAEDVYKAFKKVDVDGSGEIDREEFEILVRDMNKGIDLRQRQIDDWWTSVDDDKSGSISFPEFLVWYCGHGF